MKRLSCLLITAFVLLASFSFAFAASQDVFSHSLQQKIVNRTGVDKSDFKKYKKIFKLLSEKKIEAADKIIADIDNSLLLGHVLAVKYLNTSYTSTTEELNDWLQHYSDHYESFRIANLLERKTSQSNIFTQQDDTWLTTNAKISHKYLERLNKQDKQLKNMQRIAEI